MTHVFRFKVEKAGVWEIAAGMGDGRLPIDEAKSASHECCGGAHRGHAHGPAGPWDVAESLGDTSPYPWVLWLGAGSLVLRGVDHLLAGKSDILWAPLPGVSVLGERCGYYIREEERQPGYRVEHPQSRPWREAASAAVWAVRGDVFAGVMAEWREIANGSAPGSAAVASGLATSPPEAHSKGERSVDVKKPLEDGGAPRGGAPRGASRIESAWNRLLLDSPLRVARFERDEVQFPCLDGALGTGGAPRGFLNWKDACILNVGDWPQDVQSKYLQAWFYGTYFADPTGLFLDIVEP